MRSPVYFIRDVELIQQIGINHFDSFEDHPPFIDTNSDKLFGKSIALMNGKDWRDMRATLSPAFTGSKMRHMFELVVDCTDNVATYFSEEVKRGKPIRWEMKDFFRRYTSDVIASCAFGLKTDSLEDPTNEFYTLGKGPLCFTSLQTFLRTLCIRILPKLTCALNIELFPMYVRKLFKSLIVDTMAEREKRNILRPDMINLLMQARSGKLQHQNEDNIDDDDDIGFATVKESHIGKRKVKRAWNDDEIVAQCFIFYMAGYETTSSVMAFLSYELAINQDIQGKLFDEIRRTNETLNGSRLTYDTLSKMKYLDQVMSEALRKWPPNQLTNYFCDVDFCIIQNNYKYSFYFLYRKCTKTYELELDGKKILIEEGRAVWFPIYSVHHDPEIFENPEQFDPERFNDENKHKIHPASFIPFGIGPRNCIGECKL